jgi:hypothetical protein
MKVIGHLLTHVYNIILQELSVFKAAGEKLGMSIKGGSKGMGYNPTEKTDEGIFISKVCYTHVLITGESLNPT